MLSRRSPGFLVAAFAASIALGGCQTAPALEEPATSDSAIGVLYMSFTVITPINSYDYPAAEVVIGKIDSAGGVEKEITQTVRYDRYVVFANLGPGKYKVLRMVWKQQSAPGGPMVPVGGGFAVGISYTPSATIEFKPEVVQRTLTEVKAGEVANLGEFSATLSPKFGLPPTYETTKSDGESTEAGKRRAYEMLKTLYPDSRWSQKLKPPIFGILVGEFVVDPREITAADKGVRVLAVGKNSPASNLGILSRDVVMQIGEKSIVDRQTYYEALDKYAGKTVTVRYMHEIWERAAEVAFNE